MSLKLHIIKRIVCLLTVSLPFILRGQELPLSGIWRLVETNHIAGPEYSNVMPAIIKINKDDKATTIESIYKIQSGDTVQREVLKEGAGVVNSMKSLAKRKKEVVFYRDSGVNKWIKKTDLFQKDDNSRKEIGIVEDIRLVDSGKRMRLLRNYKGSKVTKGNSDYIIEGVYEKISPEKLAEASRSGKSINFMTGRTWQQILDLAKKERKYIFVDCYATWCGPCKKMDREVYNLNIIGELLNKNFISIKVQMDSTKGDADHVKMTYPIARALENQYNVKVLPTYLFFDPNGVAVHKESGAFSYDKFIQVVRDALDSSKQMYALTNKALLGQLTLNEMISLAGKLNDDRYGENQLAGKIVRKVLDMYLNKLSSKELFTPNNMQFLRKFGREISSAEPIFKVLLATSRVEDAAAQVEKAFSTSLIESTISNEEIIPQLEKANDLGQEPDWVAMESTITSKFGSGLAASTILDAKINWYRYQKNWDKYIHYQEMKFDFLGDLSHVSWFQLNSAAWKTFQYSDNKQQLEKALTWSQMSIANHAKDSLAQKPWLDLHDTYANLLYKLGRPEEAIKYYEKNIIPLSPKDYPAYFETLEKMKKGIKTWPEKP